MFINSEGIYSERNRRNRIDESTVILEDMSYQSLKRWAKERLDIPFKKNHLKQFTSEHEAREDVLAKIKVQQRMKRQKLRLLSHSFKQFIESGNPCLF